MTSIGYWAFSGCDSLESTQYTGSKEQWKQIFIEDGNGLLVGKIQYIYGNYAYRIIEYESYEAVEIKSYNGNETSISIPESIDGMTVTSIGDRAFSGCSNLENITLPNSVTNIGTSAFSDCSSLKSITLSGSVYFIGNYTFSGCSSLENITLPNSVANIGISAFSDCSSLKSITLSGSVWFIGDYAFFGCNSLESVQYIGSEAKWKQIFIGTGNDELLAAKVQYIIPDSEKYTYQELRSGTIMITGYHGSETSVSIPETIDGKAVTSIGEWAFQNCSSLESITLPNSVTSIRNGAFEGCSSLESITLPEGVTSIGEEAFWGCSSLKSITTPSSVTNIGDYTFLGCSSLESITLPSSVTSIGEEAFRGCSSLKSVQYAGSEAQWKQILIEEGNDELLAATIQYNYTIPDSGNTNPDSSDNSTNPHPSGQAPSTTTPAPEKLTAANVTLAKISLTYTGKVQKPAIIVKDASGKTVGTDSYNAVFQNNKNVGTASVTLTFTGSYTGTVTKTFTILPKGTTLSKLTAKKKGFTMKWKKQKTQTSGYEIQYSTNKNFKTKKTKSNIKVSATSKTISKLKVKKKYYVRIRTYKTVSGKKYYSAWSKAKTVTTKAA